MDYRKNDVEMVSGSRDPSQDNEKDLDRVVSGSVPKKYVGTEADMRDMITLGKKQVLRVCPTRSHIIANAC
jgi:hypothetical protein